MLSAIHAPHCDMRAECESPVSMLDSAGFVYCESHGLDRRMYEPCRKLRGWELRKIQRGEALRRY